MVSLRVENVANPVTNLAVVGDTWRLPIRGWSARYVASDAVLDQLERDGLVLLRYAPADGARNGSNANHDPTASSRQIAAITNSTRTVVGLTPHPQHAARASLLEARWPGSPAGKTLFESLTRWVDERQHGTAGESQR
jgi:phosphoribosylformylglycinamidine synthase